jgi:hypothetical protein
MEASEIRNPKSTASKFNCCFPIREIREIRG